MVSPTYTMVKLFKKGSLVFSLKFAKDGKEMVRKGDDVQKFKDLTPAKFLQ